MRWTSLSLVLVGFIDLMVLYFKRRQYNVKKKKVLGAYVYTRDSRIISLSLSFWIELTNADKVFLFFDVRVDNYVSNPLAQLSPPACAYAICALLMRAWGGEACWPVAGAGNHRP